MSCIAPSSRIPFGSPDDSLTSICPPSGTSESALILAFSIAKEFTHMECPSMSESATGLFGDTLSNSQRVGRPLFSKV